MRQLTILTGALLLLALVVRDPREFARKHGATQRISVATGGTGGVWYPYGGAVAQVISRHVPGVDATAEVTAGTIDNMKFLRAGAADVAFAIADGLDEAYRGVESFEVFGKVPARMLAVLYDNYTQIVTTQGSGIETVADLKGKVIATGAPGSGAETLAIRMLTVLGIDPEKDVRRQALSVSQSVDALRDGKISAFVWTGGLPTGSLLDLASSPGSKMKLLPCADLVPALNAKYGDVYRQSVIPKGTYTGVTEDIPVYVVSSVLVVDESMSDDLAYEITRALFEHRGELIAVHREAENLTLERASTGSPIPYHSGAIRFYTERGAWRD